MLDTSELTKLKENLVYKSHKSKSSLIKEKKLQEENQLKLLLNGMDLLHHQEL